MNQWDRLRLQHLPACTYCPAPATTRDHVPPTSLAGRHKNTVPACMMCNATLGGRLLWTVPERQEFMQEWYERHPNKRFLNL